MGTQFYAAYIDRAIAKGGKSSLQLMCGLCLVEAVTKMPTAEKLLPHGFYRGSQ